MTRLKTIALATLLGATSVTGAVAADAITVPPTAAPAEVPVYDNATFDWSGFYAGVYGVGQDYAGTGEYGLGVNIGANTQLDYFLLGGELALHGLTSGGGGGRTYGQALARGGLVVTDEIAVYGAAGYGVDLSAATDEHILVGGGIEAAVTEDVSLKAQYLRGIPLSGSATNQISIGANWHF